MKVKWKNTGKSEITQFLYDNNANRKFSHNREYMVYAIELDLDRAKPLGYYILDDDCEIFPGPSDADLFDISDSRLSRYWEFRKHGRLSLLSFKEWAENLLYFENLFDGGKEETATFEKYKKLIAKEFETKKEQENKLRTCMVCGTINVDNYPWGVDGVSPSFELCPCCGTQFGIDDDGENF